MKKLLAVLLTACFLLALVGCAGSAEEKSEKTVPEAKTADVSAGNGLSELYQEGFSCNMSCIAENSWKAIYIKEDSYDKVYLAEAPVTDAQKDAYDNLPFDFEVREQAERDFFLSLDGLTITDITDRVPSEETLAPLKGKTFGELENEGYSNTGYSGGDGDWCFYYDGPEYCLEIVPIGAENITDMDDMSPNDLRKLTVDKASFIGFSFGMIE